MFFFFTHESFPIENLDLRRRRSFHPSSALIRNVKHILYYNIIHTTHTHSYYILLLCIIYYIYTFRVCALKNLSRLPARTLPPIPIILCMCIILYYFRQQPLRVARFRLPRRLRKRRREKWPEMRFPRFVGKNDRIGFRTVLIGLGKCP